ELLFEMGGALYMQGDYDSAKSVLESALATFNDLGSDKSTVECLGLLAQTLQALGDDKAWRLHFERALSLRTKLEGENSEKVLIGRAELLKKDGDYKGARRILEAIISRYRERAGWERRIRPSYLDMLASVMQSLGDNKSAGETLEESLRIREKSMGKDHLNLAASHFNIGAHCWRQRDTLRAREEFLKSAEIMNANIRRGFPVLSLAEQERFLDWQVKSQLIGLLSTCTEGASLVKAYSLMYGWKGLLVESLRRQSLIARLGLNPELKPSVEKLEAVR